MKQYNIAVVGATGMVGRKFLQVLEERQLPAKEYFLFASARSAGKKMKFMGKEYTVMGSRSYTPADAAEVIEVLRDKAIDMSQLITAEFALDQARDSRGLFLCEAYADWADLVRDGDYPEDKHGYHMDPEELEKFNAMMDAFEG